MNEFNELEKVVELFNNSGCKGKENCYFIAYKDLQKSSGMVSGMEHPYGALLLNQTENGIGLFYLDKPGLSLTQNLSKMEIKKDSYQFITNDNIKEVKVKNFALFNSKDKRITIKTNDKTYKLFAKQNEKDIPYHKENFEKFVSKYSQK